MNSHPMIESPSVFICHTGLDEAYVTDLAAKLEARGIRCWYYERDNNGESIGLAVDKALEESLCLLFVMSANITETSQYVQNELIDFVRTKRKVIPLRVAMPESFWPKGSKSLIGAFPVVEDGNGRAGDFTVSEIVRRVPSATQSCESCKEAETPARRIPSSQRRKVQHVIWWILNLVMASVIVFLTFCAQNRLPHRHHRSPEEELDELVKAKLANAPLSVKESWATAESRINEAEQTVSKLEQEHISVKQETDALENAEQQGIGRGSPKYR